MTDLKGQDVVLEEEMISKCAHLRVEMKEVIEELTAPVICSSKTSSE